MKFIHQSQMYKLEKIIYIYGGGAQLIHALAHRGVLEAVVRQHHLGLGGLIDPQAGVYAQLHVTGVAVVILQHLAGDAVLVGGGAGHNAVGV